MPEYESGLISWASAIGMQAELDREAACKCVRRIPVSRQNRRTPLMGRYPHRGSTLAVQLYIDRTM